MAETKNSSPLLAYRYLKKNMNYGTIRLFPADFDWMQELGSEDNWERVPWLDEPTHRWTARRLKGIETK